MSATEQTPDPAPTKSWARRNIHFLIVVVILAVSAGGWQFAVYGLELALYKLPIRWPAPVEVDGSFQLTSFPKELASPDGAWRFEAIEAKEDKEIPDDVMESLSIGTRTDKDRLPERRSNWLFMKLYGKWPAEASGKESKMPADLWRLEAYYYTGMLDQVPHVPDRCLVAGAATLLGEKDVQFELSDLARRVPEAWRKVTFRRVAYSFRDRNTGRVDKYVQYYGFSVNGIPEPSWKLVRLKLINPFMHYTYYAKVQFGPARPVTDMDEADKRAAEFVRTFMPAMLRMLPMPEDIDRLRTEAEES